MQAYAKINLTLEITGRRSDGFHEVKSILQTIDLADRLDIEPAASLRVVCDDPDLNGESNLVWRAATSLASYASLEPKAQIYIRKRIPVGLGLGGGSSDAAAALVALNEFWQLGLSMEELLPIAADLGSDVPFFLRGGTALAEGRGERISELPALAPLAVLLVCPDDTIEDKTRQLYSLISPAHYSDGGITRRMVQTMVGGQLVVDTLHNVFEAVAFQAFPGLSELFQIVGEIVGRRPHLSGAGPAMFCLPSSEEDCQKVNQALRDLGARAYLVHAIMPRPSTDD